jgi:hypothetical protein
MVTSKATGTIKYGSRWAIVLVESSILKYYRHLYWITKSKTQKLNPGKREPHITLVAGDYETPSKPQYWGLYEGDTIEFEYSSPDNRDGMFWLPITCPMLSEIRIELGLNPNLKFPFHLTFGHIHGKESQSNMPT